MKRIFLLSLIFFSFCTFVCAQNMSDDQIIRFVQKEQKAGTSQAQIVMKLMQNGVTVDKIRQLRKKYEAATGKESSINGMGGSSRSAISKSRDSKTSSGSSRYGKNKSYDDYTSGNSDNDEYSAYRMKKNEKLSNRYKKGNLDLEEKNKYDRDMTEAEMKIMLDELNGFMPDSILAKRNAIRYEIEQKMHKKVFGQDIFSNDELSFEPNLNMAAPENYVLGPGDVVYIDIYGASQRSEECTISPDGEIVIEDFGPIKISGLTVSQANARLRTTLGKRYSSSKVKLTVGETRTIMVNVMGEVETPGTYTVSAFATVFHALYMSGGIGKLGSLRNIKVYRNNKLISVVDIYDYILNGKLSGNVKLHDNDVIVVGPYDCLVNITGKVKRPMYYEMKKTESLQTLLKYAGGFAGDAYKKTVRVLRKTGKDYAVFNVNEFDMPSFHVADGDSVAVDSVIKRYSNTVEIRGAVFRPGLYQLGGEITTVRSLLNYADGVREDAFTNRAVMHRMNEDRTLKVIPLDLKGIMDSTAADVPLMENDVIFVPTKHEIIEERTIAIHGDVMYPGIYKYAENESVEDFILQAGGLKESASTMRIDVSRRVYDPKATTVDSIISKHYTLKLKDGFVVDGEQGFILMPFDEVYVRKSPGYTDPQKIMVMGEVMYAGEYTLNKRETRLSDVLNAAGGPNARAYIEGARLERVLTDTEREQLNKLLRTEMKATGKSENEIRINIDDTYPVGIELDKALANPGGPEDIVLRDGDMVIVPVYDATVKINGEVMYPNTVSFKKGKGVKYYINQAGGYSTQAKRSNTYIIYKNGSVAKANTGSKVMPGCEIVVPSKPKKDASKLTQNLAIASSVSSLGVMIATVANLLK